MPVRIFRGTVERKIEKDIIAIEDEIDRIEKELEGEGMEIRNINLSVAIDSFQNEYVYCMIHYGSKTREQSKSFPSA